MVTDQSTADVDQVAGLSRRGLSTFATNIVSVPLALGFSILISRLLGPAGKGSVDIAFTFSTLLTLGVSLSFVSGITYEVAQRRLVPRETALGLMIIAGGQGIIAALITAAVFSAPLTSPLLPPEIPRLPFTVATGLSVSFVIAWGYMRGTFVGRQRIGIVNLADLLARVIPLLGLGLLAVFAAGSGRRIEAIEVIVLMIPAPAAALVLLLARERPAGTIRLVPRTVLARVARFALPAYGVDLLLYSTVRLDLLLVGAFIGTAAVGVYAVSAALAQLMWLLPQALAMVLLPHVASDFSGERGTATASAIACRVALATSGLIALVLAAVAPAVVPLVYGQAFSGAVIPLWLLLPGVVAFAPFTVLAAHIAGMGRPGVNVAIAFVGFATMVSLDLWLIPSAGIAGAAVTSTAAYMMMAVLTIGYFLRATGSRPGDVLLVRVSDVMSALGAARRILRAP